MSKTLMAAGFVVLVALGGAVVVLLGGSRQRTPDELEQQALNGSEEESERAALKLAQLGPEAQDALRRVLAQSKSPPVRAAAIQGLLDLGDYASVPTFLSMLDDPSPMIRGRAGVAVTQLLGRDFQYLADDPPAKRAEAIGRMRRAYREMPKQSP